MTTHSDLIEVIRKRIKLLEAVEASPKDKRTLVDTLDCSRSTIDRGIRELEVLDMLKYGPEGYHLTTYGRLAAHEYREFEHLLGCLTQHKPLLQWLPPDEEDFDFDLRWFLDAEPIVSTPSDPYAPANRHADVMITSDEFYALLPAIGLNQMQIGRKAVVDKGQEQRLVVEQAVADTFSSEPHYMETFEDIIESGRVELLVYEGKIPYFLGIYDETIHIGVEDEDGIPRALVETDTVEARTWAEQKFEEYEQQAAPLL